MALNLETEFAGKINAADANYPQGSYRDIISPSDGTGTPFVARGNNDVQGLLQKLLDVAGITPSGSPDTVLASDYFDGLMTLVTRPTLTTDTLTAIVGVKAGQVFNVAERSTGKGGSGIWVAIVTGSTVGVDLPNLTDIIVGVADPLISFKLSVDDGWLNVNALGFSTSATAAFNVSAFNRAMAISSFVYAPRGGEIYSVDPRLGQNIDIPGNTFLFFAEGVTLQAIDVTDDNYRVIQMDGLISNITIKNGIFKGDKDTHLGSTGEGGHSIFMSGANNVKLYNCEGSDAWGVGLAIVIGDGIYIEDILCDNGRQNSAAIVSASNLELIRPRFTNASGTAPAAGLDIEPNVNSDVLQNIKIIDPYTEGNEGVGIQISLGPGFVDSNNDVDITITNHVDRGSERGFFVSQLPISTIGSVDGTINYINGTMYDNEKSGILISNYASTTTPKIFIDHPVIYRPNNSEATLVFDSAGIAFDRAIAFTNTNRLGNVHIKNPVIIDNRSTPKMVNAINFSDFKTVGYENATIEDPLQIEGVIGGDTNNLIKLHSDVVFTNQFKVASETVTTSKSLSSSSGYGTFDNAGAGGIVTFNLPGTFGLDTILTEIEFVDNSGTKIRLEPGAGKNILPLSTVNDKFIESTARGDKIILKKNDDSTWYIESIIGTWSVEA